MMKSPGLWILPALTFVLAGCVQYRQPPKTKMVEMAYFTCSMCGSLEGGIFGKGPVKKWEAAAASHCVHDWQRISYGEFKTLATRRFGVDWSREIPFWNRPMAER